MVKRIKWRAYTETEEYGISSFVYEARKPFYPEKFHKFLHSKDLSGKLIRSKGFFGLLQDQCLWVVGARAGGVNFIMDLLDYFGRQFQKIVGQQDKESLDFIHEKWVEPFGDMRQELVFIGQGLDKNKIVKLLDECLLSKEDLLLGVKHWKTFSDPFPKWGELE